MSISEVDAFRPISVLERLLSSLWPSRVLLLLSGAIYPLAFSPFEIWPLAYLSIFILLYALVSSSRSSLVSLSPSQLGFFWGLGAFLVGTSWVYVSVHRFGYVPAPGAVIITLLFVMLIASFKALFGYLCVKLLQYCYLSAFIAIAPLCWLVSEYVQSNIFSGFPWLLIGYSQIDSPLSVVATWFGVYGLGWLSVTLAACLVLLLTTKDRNKYWLCIVLVLVLVLIAKVYDRYYIEISPYKSEVDVALVQPNISQDQKWVRQYFSSILDVLFAETKPVWDAEIIVWPEGAIPAYAHQVKRILDAIESKVKHSQSHLLVGIPEYEEETERSYVALKSLGENSQTYYKQVLVPFGEYVPLESWLRGAIQFLDLPMSSFTKADSSQNPIFLDKVTLIPAICYEIVYPNILYALSVKSNRDKPQMIVTVSNDAWFGDSLGPYQHMQMARMRAVELGIPLIRSTNDGITAVVDEKGKVIRQLPRYQQTHLRHSVEIENRVTMYRYWGFWGMLLFILPSCIGILFSYKQKRKYRKHKAR